MFYLSLNDQGQVDSSSEQLQNLQQASDLRGVRKGTTAAVNPQGVPRSHLFPGSTDGGQKPIHASMKLGLS